MLTPFLSLSLLPPWKLPLHSFACDSRHHPPEKPLQRQQRLQQQQRGKARLAASAAAAAATATGAALDCFADRKQSSMNIRDDDAGADSSFTPCISCASSPFSPRSLSLSLSCLLPLLSRFASSGFLRPKAVLLLRCLQIRTDLLPSGCLFAPLFACAFPFSLCFLCFPLSLHPPTCVAGWGKKIVNPAHT